MYFKNFLKRLRSLADAIFSALKVLKMFIFTSNFSKIFDFSSKILDGTCSLASQARRVSSHIADKMSDFFKVYFLIWISIFSE